MASIEKMSIDDLKAEYIRLRDLIVERFARIHQRIQENQTIKSFFKITSKIKPGELKKNSFRNESTMKNYSDNKLQTTIQQMRDFLDRFPEDLDLEEFKKAYDPALLYAQTDILRSGTFWVPRTKLASVQTQGSSTSSGHATHSPSSHSTHSEASSMASNNNNSSVSSRESNNNFQENGYGSQGAPQNQPQFSLPPGPRTVSTLFLHNLSVLQTLGFSLLNIDKFQNYILNHAEDKNRYYRISPEEIIHNLTSLTAPLKSMKPNDHPERLFFPLIGQHISQSMPALFLQPNGSFPNHIIFPNQPGAQIQTFSNAPLLHTNINGTKMPTPAIQPGQPGKPNKTRKRTNPSTEFPSVYRELTIDSQTPDSTQPSSSPQVGPLGNAPSVLLGAVNMPSHPGRKKRGATQPNVLRVPPQSGVLPIIQFLDSTSSSIIKSKTTYNTASGTAIVGNVGIECTSLVGGTVTVTVDDEDFSGSATVEPETFVIQPGEVKILTYTIERSACRIGRSGFTIKATISGNTATIEHTHTQECKEKGWPMWAKLLGTGAAVAAATYLSSGSSTQPTYSTALQQPYYSTALIKLPRFNNKTRKNRGNPPEFSSFGAKGPFVPYNTTNLQLYPPRYLVDSQYSLQPPPFQQEAKFPLPRTPLNPNIASYENVMKNPHFYPMNTRGSLGTNVSRLRKTYKPTVPANVSGTVPYGTVNGFKQTRRIKQKSRINTTTKNKANKAANEEAKKAANAKKAAENKAANEEAKKGANAKKAANEEAKKGANKVNVYNENINEISTEEKPAPKPPLNPNKPGPISEVIRLPEQKPPSETTQLPTPKPENIIRIENIIKKNPSAGIIPNRNTFTVKYGLHQKRFLGLGPSYTVIKTVEVNKDDTLESLTKQISSEQIESGFVRVKQYPYLFHVLDTKGEVKKLIVNEQNKNVKIKNYQTLIE
jgi:hypothetical protein